MTQVEAGEAQVEADRQEMKKLLDEIAQGARETREGCSYYFKYFYLCTHISPRRARIKITSEKWASCAHFPCQD